MKAKVHLMQARMTLRNYDTAQQADNDLFSSAAALGNASTDLGECSSIQGVDTADMQESEDMSFALGP
jgi:hypothetical protein